MELILNEKGDDLKEKYLATNVCFSNSCIGIIRTGPMGMFSAYAFKVI